MGNHTALRRDRKLRQHFKESHRQNGIEIPRPGQQQHVLIIRLDIFSAFDDSGNTDQFQTTVRQGLKKLCSIFDHLDTGAKKIDYLESAGYLSRKRAKYFNFSSTVGFGIGFFEKLSIAPEKWPRKLKAMPDYSTLLDIVPYSLVQTDLIIQLASTSDIVNRFVFDNPLKFAQNKEDPNNSELDILTAIRGWATVNDIHIGFQRIDGRNLMGFYDGLSNPRPGSGDLFDRVVWTTEGDEHESLKDGTYMVFQKIQHDLDQWQALSVEEQEEWVGRNKETGLLLGTPENDDQEFIKALRNDDWAAKRRLRKLIREQSNPETPFYDKSIFSNNVPAWSHARKANPRQNKNEKGIRVEKKIIFRRGYPFMEPGPNNRTVTGLLFISFQRDIANTFEFIKKKFLNNKNFPTPERRRFTKQERDRRHSQGRFSARELDHLMSDSSHLKQLGMVSDDMFREIREQTDNHDAQCTGREGLSGPSELGVTATAGFLAIIPFGGGYYFIPPIPNTGISDIGQQFF